MHDERRPVPVLDRDTARLTRGVCWGLENGLDPRELVSMLTKLCTRVPEGSDLWVFATQQLAEQLLTVDPWRAAVTARTLLAHAESDAALAVLGLAHARLGNFRASVQAFRRALTLSPGCPSYSHNLGHLLDLGLNRPRDALPYLASALRDLPDAEVAASYAHALWRTGQQERARSVLLGYLSQTDAEALWGDWT